jgi:PTS system cellobiose-specific IIC component
MAGLAIGLAAFLPLVSVHGPFMRTIPTRLALAEMPAFGVMAFALIGIVSWQFARRLNLSRPITMAAAGMAFLIALPRPFTPGDPLGFLTRVGASGLLLAIIAGIAVAGACSMFRRVIADDLAAQAAGASVVVACAAALFYADVSLGNVLLAALRPLGALGDSYAALLVIVLAQTLLWTFGVHGPAALSALLTPVYMTLQLQNTAAFGHHEPLPHIVVVSLFLFVFPGGAGATLPLAALLAFSRVERLRNIGRLTLLPAIFNVNEPLIFGLPVAFNPLLAVPFVLVPVVLATISYLAIAHGWVARPAWYVPSGLPFFASTYLATLDVRAVVLATANVCIATLIYLPFVRAYERAQ